MLKGTDKLKNKTRLGNPPSFEEASQNLREPELSQSKQESPEIQTRIDGRQLKKTMRTMQFATRVTPEFDLSIRQIAQKENLLIVEVLERALELYKKHIDSI